LLIIPFTFKIKFVIIYLSSTGSYSKLDAFSLRLLSKVREGESESGTPPFER